MSIKLKLLDIKKALKINEIINRKEKENEIDETPIYKKIYPPLRDLFIYDENNEINNNLLKIKTKISKVYKKTNFLHQEINEDEEEMNEEFLNDLVKNPCPLSKAKVIGRISKFIEKSKLIEKLESEYQSDKKIASNSLSRICSEKLTYIELQPGEVIFKIGEPGDKFYFILNGNVSILKLKELSDIFMTYIQYINYCMFLINSKEEYILNEVIKANDKLLNISSIEDIKTINKIIFMRQITEKINKYILNNNHLKIFFQQNGQNFHDYDIKEEELETLEQQKLKGMQGAGKEWENYITKRCKLTVTEQVFFQPYEKIFTDKKPKKITCFCYYSFLYLGPGLFFGDNALDFENNKRNATIRAEENTILAYLKRDDYLNIISPKHKMEKLKEIEFLYEKFFFGEINSHLFEKNYFHLFSPREYFRGNILFSNGTIPHSLILLKSGRISIEFKGSVIDIHNLIKYIYNNIFTNPLFSKLSQGNKNRYLPNNKLAIIKNYINDPVLTRLKMHNNEFIAEMNIIKNYQVKIITKDETIGLEEIFLRLPYIMKSIVISQKIYCYELAMEHFNKILNNGKEIIHSYIRFSLNRIISLIERLQNIKQNEINMSLFKYEKEMIKFRNLKNSSDDSNKKNDKKNQKERKYESRNIINNDLSNSNTYRDKEILFNNSNENIKNYSTIIYNNSSPIKLFMANISPESKSMIEKIRLVGTKYQKKQIKIKDNNNLISMNNTANLKNGFKTTTNKNHKNNNRNNKYFFETIGINKGFSNDSILKEDSQTSYTQNINNSLTPKYTFSKIIIDKNENKNHTNKSFNENEYKNDSKFNFNKKVEAIKNHPFNMSFIPLDLICRNDNIDNENIPFIPNINKLIKINKKTIDFYNTIGLINYNNDNIYKSNRNDRILGLKKRLKMNNKKYLMRDESRDKNIEKPLNIVNKKMLITGIIKDYYKDKRLNGYSSFIHNKEINTVFMRKFNKKYDSAEKLQNNIKLHILKKSDSLPVIH